MHTRILDRFDDPSVWTPIASGQAQLTLTAEPAPDLPQAPAGEAEREGPPPSARAGTGPRALRLDFDFRGGGGFVVARREIRLSLPDSFAFLLELRGHGLPNAFEFKLIDPSGVNVWRYREDACDIPSGWRTLRIPSRRIGFGWGPAGGGTPREVGAIEIVLAAPPGGAGSLSIGGLRLEDRTPSAQPGLLASSARPGHGPERVADGRADTRWVPEALPAWIEIDFREPRDYGGLTLRWASPAPRSFAVLAGEDGAHWQRLYSAPRSAGETSPVYLPEGCSRRLRIEIDEAPGVSPAGDSPPPGLIAVEIEPESFSASLDGFFHALAERSPRGRWPRWLYREQTYWTSIDVADGTVPALFNEEGMVEIARAGWSVEPMVAVDGRAVGWADCDTAPGLVRPPLPIPLSQWSGGALGEDLTLVTAAWAERVGGAVRLRLRVRVTNRGGGAAHAVRLYTLIRPFQVSPPWQGWKDIGGLSPIRSLEWRDGTVHVNGAAGLTPLAEPAAFGALAFDEGNIADAVAAGVLPAAISVEDPFGCASGALAFDLGRLGEGESRAVEMVAPLGIRPAGAAVDGENGLDSGPDRDADIDSDTDSDTDRETGEPSLARAIADWTRTLSAVELRLPAAASVYADTCKGAIAHILIHRHGPVLQPGPRRYTRAWIRDGAVMAAALLRFGLPDQAGAFIRWYARFQAADGNVPCCVDLKDGGGDPDWLPEHDSHGELCFAVADYYRFTGDRRLVEELWPAVRKAVGYIEGLRAERLTAPYAQGELQDRRGLLPESASHEGYLAHPVHAYWDDFWALRGLKDAVELAEVLGEREDARRIARLRDELQDALHASVARVMTEHGLDYVPASVELADIDPTSLANAVTLADELHRLPRAAVERTFDRFLDRFRAMRRDRSLAWTNYTPYEIRNLGALVRLGRREDAHEVARVLLGDRRPPVWSQWPEIVWPDLRAPGHQGDLPHAWIGAEYCLALRDCFAYERESDRSLVIAAGIPAAWLDDGEVAVRALPTWYGRLDLSLKRGPGGALVVRIGGELRLPPGGIRLAPPLAGGPIEVRVDGTPSADIADGEIRVAALPAEVSVVVS